MPLIINAGRNALGDLVFITHISETPLHVFYNLSPDSLLLHGLHFLSTGDHAVYYLFLLICQVLTRTRAWLRGPVAPVSPKKMLLQLRLQCFCNFTTYYPISTFAYTCDQSKHNE